MNTLHQLQIRLLVITVAALGAINLTVMGHADDIPSIDEFVQKLERAMDNIETVESRIIPVYDPRKSTDRVITVCYQRTPLRHLQRDHLPGRRVTWYLQQEGDDIYKHAYTTGYDGIERHRDESRWTHEKLVDWGHFLYLLKRGVKKKVTLEKAFEDDIPLWKITIANQNRDQQYIFTFDIRTMLLRQRITMADGHVIEKTAYEYSSLNQKLPEDCFDMGAPPGTPNVSVGASRPL
ncbi:MAG: hypothetical protein K8I00_08400 [Candidatus Omnitrophica bacterium]|nr:hypothetical protein [Candidatus Omnitrophota bacterium]